MRFIIKLCLSFLILWVIGFFWFLNIIPKTLKDDYSTSDAIVVFTGGKGRITEGVALLVTGRAKKLFISGVGQHANMQQIETLSEELEAIGFSHLEDKIILGHLATNTKENAIESASWIKANEYNSVKLVTSNYHMPRSLLQFRLYLEDQKIIAHPVFSSNFKSELWWQSYRSAKLIFSEYNKYIIVLIKFLNKKCNLSNINKLCYL